MNNFNRLPKEIILLIFSELDYTQLLEIENVCQKWKEVLDLYSSLWKREIELDCRSKKNLWKNKQKVQSILARSGGEMQSWIIKVSVSSLNFYQNVFNLIPPSNAQSLIIDLTDEDNYGSNNADDLYLQREYENLANMVKRCPNLKSLHFEVESEIEILFGQSIKSYPIANCSLQTLFLRNVSLNSLYSDGSIFNMVSKAKEINLSGSQIGTDSDIVRLIDAAKDTLEQCSVRLLGTTKPDDIFYSINLPKLQKLKILNYFEGSAPTGPMQYSLSCPNLRQLKLSGRFSSSLCANLLTESINTLCLEIDELNFKSIKNNLRKCKNLVVIRIILLNSFENRFSSHHLEELLDELISLPIKQFVICRFVRSDWQDESMILEFFQKRSKNSDSVKMKDFFLYQDNKISSNLLENLLQYSETVNSFCRDQEDSTYSEEELQLRSYGDTIGIV